MDQDSQRNRGGASDEALRRLAVYGSLAPGRKHHHQLDGLRGRWLKGDVHGTVLDRGWAAQLGYPALILDPEGPAVEVHVFESVDLPAHWSRLDEFEGRGYRRVVVSVRTPEGDLAASIYVLDEQG